MEYKAIEAEKSLKGLYLCTGCVRDCKGIKACSSFALDRVEEGLKHCNSGVVYIESK